MKLYGMLPMTHFSLPNDIHPLFLQETIKRGIMIYNSHNLNFAHQQYHIDLLLAVYDEVFHLIKNDKVALEGVPVEKPQLLRQCSH